MARRLLLAYTLLALSGCSPSQITSLKDLGLRDWAALQAKLASAVPNTLRHDESVYDRILDSKTAKAIHARGTQALWLSMCRSGEPFVSLLGFRCVSERSPDNAFQAALATLANRGVASLSLFSEPLELVHEATPTDDNKQTFSRFVSDPENSGLKLDELTSFLDESFIYDWAVHADLTSVPASIQCVAVGQVYATSIEDRSLVPDSVATVFETFDKNSGDCLATFVWYAPPSVSEDRLQVAIERLLQDDIVSRHMYQVALRQRIDFIKNHVDVGKLQLSPEHQERYTRWLESVAKRKGA